MDPTSHYFDVTILISNFRNSLGNHPLRLIMPTWTPGSYLIREFSRNVLELVALDDDSDEKLVSYKTSKNTWQIEANTTKNVRAKYRVYAFEFTVDTSFLDNLHAVVNGASVFMYVEGLEKEELRLELRPPKDWKKISTSLEMVGEEEDSKIFKAPNYDVLIDSPIEIGNQQTHSFILNGIEHEISIFSKSQFDQAKLVSDLKKVVESTIPVFSQIPYDRYLFLIDFTAEGGGGGLEHLSSTHCIASVYNLEPIQEYRRLLSLFSHEFFHAWNVKRMRPAGLGPFDYSNETYTKSLWIAEGITSYYDDYILRRTKIYSVVEYLDAFSNNINIMKTFPGSRWQSAEEASFDAWIKQYRQNENSPNVLSSYYIQGTVLGWMLDMEIRKVTNLEKNLDDAIRSLYQETYVKENRGYTEEEFERICEDIIGNNRAKDIFELRVRGRKEVDFDKYLGYAGLKLVPKKPQQVQGFLGAKLKQEQGKLVVSSVLSDSPGENCGLTAVDEIIALDGIRTDLSKCTWYIGNMKPDTSVKILISRFGTLQELEARTTTKPVLEHRIAKLDESTQDQRKLFREWMDEDWEKEITYDEYTPSPTRKALFDYV